MKSFPLQPVIGVSLHDFKVDVSAYVTADLVSLCYVSGPLKLLQVAAAVTLSAY
jgi:hypothetical protein